MPRQHSETPDSLPFRKEAERAAHERGDAAQNDNAHRGPPPRKNDHDEVEEASQESFPASDPPSWSPGTAAPAKGNGEPGKTKSV